MRKTSEENFKDNIDLSYKQLLTDIKKAKSLENNSHRSLGQTDEERKALQDDAIKR